MTPELKEHLLTKLRKGFVECDIPSHCREGLELYLTEGILPGSFLTACLQNNFKEAAGRADHINARYLKNYATLMYNFMPSDSQGSVEKVFEWVEQFEE